MTAAIEELDGGYLPAADLAYAERVVAGTAITSAAKCEELGELLRPEHFHVAAASLAYGAALGLAESGRPVDPVAVMSELARSGDLGKIGGAPYLHDLMAIVPVAANAGYHARRVRADWERRDAHVASARAHQMTAAPDFDLGAWRAEASALIEGAGGTASATAVPSMADLANQVLGDIDSGAPRGIPTGISADLDAALAGGIVAGQLVIIAARPGAGKSVAVAQAAYHVAERLGRPVLLESLEMTAAEITTRLYAAEARVSLMDLLTRSVGEAHWDRIAGAHKRIAGSPLRIDYAPGRGLPHARSRLRGLRREGGAAMLAVDYLQLLAEPRGAESRQAAVAANTRALKDLAGEEGIPVLCAVQLNRNAEKRASKRPELADLRESGEIEQAADIVILLHREDMYERESPRAGEMDMIVAKNRQGPNTTVTVGFQGHYSRIVDLAAEWTPTSVLERRR